MVMPNFLIIGAAKSGTTALYNYLAQHPDIFLSPLKEPYFFALEGRGNVFKGPKDEKKETISTLEEYKSLFRNVKSEHAVGEASPLYLYDLYTPRNIKKYIPDVKLIVILRNPVDRAYSSYMHLIRDERETIRSFSKALKEESSRINNSYALMWHYKNAGFYYDQLKRYYRIFDESQIKVYLYDEFKAKPQMILSDIFSYLGVDDSFEPNVSIKYNTSGITKSKFVKNLVRRKNPVKSVLKPLMPASLRHKIKMEISNKNVSKPQLSKELRNQLIDEYYDDILKLQDLIQKDLNSWLKKV